jgi:hypothetical protein
MVESITVITLLLSALDRGAFPKCEIFLADEEHHNLPLDETVPLARWRRLRC